MLTSIDMAATCMRGHQPPTHHTDRQLPNSLAVASTGRQGASSGYRARAPLPPRRRPVGVARRHMCTPQHPGKWQFSKKHACTRHRAIDRLCSDLGVPAGFLFHFLLSLSFPSLSEFRVPFLLLHTLSSFFFSRTLPSFFLLPPPLYTLPRYEKSAGQGVDFIARASVTLRVTLQ